eukprot:SM000408S15243  [mRNA]  locus=s408:25639:28651:+ [translate_table: standard]
MAALALAALPYVLSGTSVASQAAYWVREWWKSGQIADEASVAPYSERARNAQLMDQLEKSRNASEKEKAHILNELKISSKNLQKLMDLLEKSRDASETEKARISYELRITHEKLQQAEEETCKLVEDCKQQIAEAVQQASTALSKWKTVIAHKAHLSEPLELLQDLQARIRASLPPYNPKWRHVVVIGSSGLGKTTFVRQMLDQLDYPGSMNGDHLRTSANGAGTTGDYDYVFDNKNLTLTDLILAADLVIMFLSENCRAEEPHGDALALAYRLCKSMSYLRWTFGSRIITRGLSKQLLVEEEVLARAHSKLAKDLVEKLRVSVNQSVDQCNIEIAPDLQVLMRLDAIEKIDKLRPIIELRCFFSQKNYDTGHEAYPNLLPGVMKVTMQQERQALVDLICGKVRLRRLRIAAWLECYGRVGKESWQGEQDVGRCGARGRGSLGSSAADFRAAAAG